METRIELLEKNLADNKVLLDTLTKELALKVNKQDFITTDTVDKRYVNLVQIKRDIENLKRDYAVMFEKSSVTENLLREELKSTESRLVESFKNKLQNHDNVLSELKTTLDELKTTIKTTFNNYDFKNIISKVEKFDDIVEIISKQIEVNSTILDDFSSEYKKDKIKLSSIDRLERDIRGLGGELTNLNMNVSSSDKNPLAQSDIFNRFHSIEQRVSLLERSNVNRHVVSTGRKF